MKRFSGAKVACLKDHKKPSLRESPDHSVWKITGTYCKVYHKCGVGSSLKSDSHDVSISSFVMTNDILKEKAAQVNENLENLCAERNIYFINQAKNILP